MSSQLNINKGYHRNRTGQGSYRPPQTATINTNPGTSPGRSGRGGGNKKKPNYNPIFAKRIVAKGKYSARFMDDTLQIMEWNNSFWEKLPDVKGELLAWTWLKQVDDQESTPTNSRECWKAAKMDLACDSKFPSPAKQDGFVLPMKDCYLQINKNGQIKVIEPKKELGLTYAVPFAFGVTKEKFGTTHTPKAVPCDSMFGKYLAHAMPDEEIRSLLQEQCAMTFLPTGSHQTAAWWFGQGNDGKGTLLKILTQFHAKVTTLKLHALDKDHYLDALVDASMVVVDEVSTGKWCEETFKSCVSGDSVMINPKLKTIYRYCPTATWIVASNGAPFVTDKTNGVWRRVVPIEWCNPIEVGSDSEIEGLDKMIIEKEHHIVLDWLLEGLQRILVRGKVLKGAMLPETTKNLIAELRGENDSIRQWLLSEKPCYSELHAHTKDDIYAAYEEFCEEDHGSLVASNHFWRILKQNQEGKKIIQSEYKSTGPDGKRKRTMKIALTPQEIKEVEDDKKVTERAKLLPKAKLDDDIQF